VESVNASVPLVDLTPVQPLEAVQDSEDVEDQDKSKELFSSTELALEMDTVGEGTVEDPPPPQALSNVKLVINAASLVWNKTLIKRNYLRPCTTVYILLKGHSGRFCTLRSWRWLSISLSLNVISTPCEGVISYPYY